MGGFQLSGWEHPYRAVEASVVEPVEVLQGGQFEVVKFSPGAMRADDFGLEQLIEAFGQGVIVALSGQSKIGSAFGPG